MAATFDFSGHAVRVTGGTRGIGRAMAEAFAAAGAEMTVTGTRTGAGGDQPAAPALTDIKAIVRGVC